MARRSNSEIQNSTRNSYRGGTAASKKEEMRRKSGGCSKDVFTKMNSPFQSKDPLQQLEQLKLLLNVMSQKS